MRSSLPMTISPDDTNQEKKEKKRVPSDEEMFYGIVDTRTEEEQKSGREEGSEQEQAPTSVLAPKATTANDGQQAMNPPTPTNGTPANGDSTAIEPAARPVSTVKPGMKTRLEDIMDLVGEGKSIWDALVTVFGLHEPNYKYLILERTRLTKEEANLVSDALFIAEHGMGTEPFDFPIPEFADWVISRLHAFISVDMGKGNARDEFREITSTWVAALKAKLNAQTGADQINQVDQGLGIGARNP